MFLKNDATDLKKINSQNKTYEIIYDIQNLNAPLKKNDIVGTAEIIDNEGNIIDNIDIIVNDSIKKASYIDYFVYNLKIVLNGK